MFLIAAARAQALTALANPVVSTSRILALRDRLQAGTFDGTNCDTCFFGILGGGTLNGYESLRRSLGMATPPRGELDNPIEAFCFGINRSSSQEVVRSGMLLDWIDFELSRRRTSTSVPISVTEDEVNSRLDSVEADRLIEETRSAEPLLASV